MTDWLLPPLTALLLWWGGTGAVIVLERAAIGRAARVAWATAPALCVLAALPAVGRRDDTGGAYAGFVAALVLWGWHEIAFLRGWTGGPRRQAASAGASRWRRLAEAVQVLLWHELALAATAAALWLLTADAPNRMAAHAFALLWVMRLSSKFNLYLGVRNLALEFLPPRLAYLGSYFRRTRLNALMPLTLALGAGVLALWLAQAAGLDGGPRAARLLLASLLALALLEHLMMVLPVDPAALWRWALRRGSPPLAAR